MREVSEVVGSVVLDTCVAVGDMGHLVYPAAKTLVHWMVRNEVETPGWIKGKEVVELGAGTGVVGLAAALLGGFVTITDLPVYLDSINTNIQRNAECIEKGGGKASAAGLDWEQDPPASVLSTNLVLVSDCIYYEGSLEPLVGTLRKLCQHGAAVLLSYEERPEKETIYQKFFQLVSQNCFVVDTLWTEVSHQNNYPIYLLKIKSI